MTTFEQSQSYIRREGNCPYGCHLFPHAAHPHLPAVVRSSPDTRYPCAGCGRSLCKLYNYRNLHFCTMCAYRAELYGLCKHCDAPLRASESDVCRALDFSALENAATTTAPTLPSCSRDDVSDSPIFV